METSKFYHKSFSIEAILSSTSSSSNIKQQLVNNSGCNSSLFTENTNSKLELTGASIQESGYGNSFTDLPTSLPNHKKRKNPETTYAASSQLKPGQISPILANDTQEINFDNLNDARLDITSLSKKIRHHSAQSLNDTNYRMFKSTFTTCNYSMILKTVFLSIFIPILLNNHSAIYSTVTTYFRTAAIN